MRLHSPIGLFLFAAALAVTVPLSAQDQTEPPRARVAVNPFEEAAFREKMQTARTLIRHQDYLSASDLLETLSSEKPGDEVVYSLLTKCYRQLKLNDKLLSLVERMLSVAPNEFAYRLDHARVLVDLEQNDRASRAFEGAVATVTQEKQLKNILEAMVEAGLEDDALLLIDSLLSTVEDRRPLHYQRGLIMERQKNYAAATAEYFQLLADTTRMASDAERRLLDLLKFEESGSIVEQEILQQTDSVANLRALRLMSNHYLNNNDFEGGFQLAIVQDSLENAQGRPLLRFLKACHDRKQYAEAVRIAQYIIDNYPNSPVLVQAYWTYAEALGVQGHYDSALAVYDTAFALLPRGRDKSETLARIAQIHCDLRQDPSTALRYIDSIKNHFALGLGYLRALRLEPQCYLQKGDMDRAFGLLEEMKQRRLTDEAYEEITYFQGLIHFCQGKLDSARSVFQQLVVKYQRGFYVNDALHLQMLMDRAAQSPEVLGEYSRAAYYELRRMPDSLRMALERVADAPDKSLADLSLHRLAYLSLNSSDTAAAVTYIDQLVEQMPESYYVPYGKKLKADILGKSQVTRGDARALYRELLELHPHYPFASEVRERLRQIEADDKIG